MIKLNKIHLENFRGFSDVKLNFNDKVTCIAGINGAGKSTILDGLSKSLIALVRPVYNKNFENINIQDIKQSDINANAKNNYSSITLDYNFDSNSYAIKIDSDGQIENNSCNTDLIKKIENELPIIAYYTINRSEIDVDISVSDKDLSNRIEAVSNSISATTHYKDFFQWFRDREDRENAVKLDLYENESSNKKYEDKELKAVRESINKLLPNCKRMRVDSKRQSVLINKDNTTIDFNNMSDGEKGIITLFGDIARRLAIANENLENPLDGNGIILIDEIDLHLHPSLQRKVCKALKETFPNCQFIITTHSPQVLGELQPEEIRLLDNFEISIPTQSYGLSSNSIIKKLMGNGKFDYSQNEKVSEKLKKIENYITNGKYNEAKSSLIELDNETYGSTAESVELMSVLTTLFGVE